MQVLPGDYDVKTSRNAPTPRLIQIATKAVCLEEMLTKTAKRGSDRGKL